ncbi:MipA/OmpV family protein [Alginatibacterium sediminis]|uniref:MipA/OmpV family protein n=1 Tax=Alginatibacterium sediminis TaxID=2164068 RepID=UPI001314BC99|nr:MipA/OmpV family protein [Alginatibacterium sediminis]
MRFLLIFNLIFITQALANDNNRFININGDDDWLLGISLRNADIPFAEIETSNGEVIPRSDKVKDLVPLFYYEGDYLYLEGAAGGIKFWDEGSNTVSLHSEFRFFDMPAEVQNLKSDNGIDVGVRWQYKFSQDKALLASLMSNSQNLPYSKIEYRQKTQFGNLIAIPYVQATIKSAEFNDYFYGLNFATDYDTNAKADIDWRLGASFRYPIWQEFSVIGDLAVNRLGHNTRSLETIDSDYELQSSIGISFSGESIGKPIPENPGYVRVAHAWGTPSNLDDIIHGNTEKDFNNNQLTSLFYGHKLSDTLLTLPIEVYATPGIAYHHSSAGQDRFLEYVFAFKGYYTLPLPWRIRLGVAEGLSYTSQISDLEQREIVDKKGYANASKLLNYLDFSLDISIGDVFRKNELKELWLGYGIHHRSAIFESSSLFGRIKGGSNYQSVYLQWHW